jgi:Nif-specific regulatory protein
MQERELILKKNRELGAVLEVSRVLTSSFDLGENLKAAMKTLGAMLDMQRGCVFLLDPSSKEMRIVAAYGLTEEEIRRGKYRIGEGIVGGVLESRTPAYIPDIGDEPRFLNKTGARLKKEGISFMCVPIELKGEALGVMSVDRIYSSEHGGVEDDLRVLRIVASLIAQFVKLWGAFRKADEERESLRSQLKDRYSLPNIIGESEKFRSVLKAVLKAAETDATALLLGESGTGKELIARTLHYEGKRAGGPFVAVNCAALPDTLLEVELFGCEKGAFTGATSRRTGRFEAAEGGTIFLDEIGEMPLALQAKLLRVLEARSFERLGSSTPIKANARVIAATNKRLLDEVRKGAFREDLYWRLNVLPIVLPPLRERKPDIPLLVNHYLEKFNRAYGKRAAISAEALDALAAYGWPGNVRELANTMERLVIMCDKSTIGIEDIPSGVRNIQAAPEEWEAASGAASNSSLRAEVLSLEKERILRALRENDFVQYRAASALGITPRQLGYRVKKYGIALR